MTDLGADLAQRMPVRFFITYLREHGRDLPWRSPPASPYETLLVELLVRQTRAEQVVPVWEHLRIRYPTPQHLVTASYDDLFHDVAVLGLGQQRAKALRLVAETLVARHRGLVPRALSELSALPHTGLYTAHAVNCFARGQRLPVVDGNILRLFTRLTGQPLGRDNRRSAASWEAATMLVSRIRSARWHNWGLLDFCAQVCKPIGPRCFECPLQPQCVHGLQRLAMEPKVTP